MIIIPPVPPGVEDPKDLAYGKRSNFGIARWDDPEFHDRLAWILETVGAALEVSYFTARGGDPMNPEGYRLPVQVAFTDAGGQVYAPDAYDIRFMPHVIRIGLLAQFVPGATLTIENYPGFDVRHPPHGDPVGEPWPELEAKWRRRAGTLFHPSAADGAQWRYDDIDRPFERPDGARFVKRSFIVRSSGFWSEKADAWERF